jgi:hypothetical protein
VQPRAGRRPGLHPSVSAVVAAAGKSAKAMSETVTRRQLCTTCGRPCRVCLCSSLPASPLRLEGLLLVLQHPHEAKRRLATVPVLQKCLGLCAVIRDRRLLVRACIGEGACISALPTYNWCLHALSVLQQQPSLPLQLAGMLRSNSSGLCHVSAGCSHEQWAQMPSCSSHTWLSARRHVLQHA